MRLGHLLCGALGAAASVSPVAAQIIVGPNVHVSVAHPGWPHYECYLAADPHDASRLLGTSMFIDPVLGSYRIVVYASADGGRSWRESLLAPPTAHNGDPVVAFDPGGHGYFVEMTVREPGSVEVLLVRRSSDGGTEWAPPVPLTIVDREGATFDGSGGRYDGRMYVHGTEFDPDGHRTIVLYRSSDGGTTFESARRQAGDSVDVLILGNGAVMHDGTWVAVLSEYMHRPATTATWTQRETNGKIEVVTSSDGGVTLDAPIPVSEFTVPTAVGSTAVAAMASDATSGPYRDRLYAVWSDQRSGRVEIRLAYSSDRGKTWSPPVTVNDDRPRPARDSGPHHAMPLVAVNRHGVVAVAWNDRRAHSDNWSYDVRLAASLDGGVTFTPSVRVSTGSYEARRVAPVFLQTVASSAQGRLVGEVRLGSFQATGGDTGGLVADAAGAFHVLWMDNRTRIPQLWTAMVTVDRRAITHGDSSLASLHDVTERLALRLSRPRYAPRLHRVTVQATLINTSARDSLIGPIHVRAVQLRSDFGVLRALNAANGRRASGAVWIFADTLPPGGRSRPRPLVFRLLGPSPLRQPDTLDGWAAALVKIEAQTFAAEMRSYTIR